MGYQYYCRYGDTPGDLAALQSKIDDPELERILFPGCGAVGEPQASFAEANAVGLEHNGSNTGHGGSVDEAVGAFQYYCTSGDTAATDPEVLRQAAQDKPEYLELIFPGCGPVGAVQATFDAANNIGLEHNASGAHGGYVAEVGDAGQTGADGPSDDQYAAMHARNTDNIKATPDKGTISFFQASYAVLVGGGHDGALQQWVQDNQTGNGTITVKKAGAFDKGKLTVSGSTEEDAMRWALEQVSDKTIVFE